MTQHRRPSRCATPGCRGAGIRWAFILCGVLFPLTVPASIHHRLSVEVHAEQGEISVEDELVLEKPAVFSLAEAFSVAVSGGRLERKDSGLDGIADYRLVPDGGGPVILRYAGAPARGDDDIFGMPHAVVDGQGVFLDASSGWYPLFRQQTLTFELTVTLPAGWEIVGQGPVERGEDGRFRVAPAKPQEDIYLLAGPYVRYADDEGPHPLAVYLLQPDEPLARSYLDAMRGYLRFYDALIGEYPHHGFAVVENRWQTGYGMPGFTLLGSRVLRLPFLLKTSLPHELVHNWLGNGVYIDGRDGNWSEGLTAYLADYLIKEADGKGVEYRRRSLARYTDFASDGRDIPVAEFRSRHDDASQAVGYDKVLLLFHMLRRQIGDEAFVDGLRRFYHDYRYRRAGFMDLLQSFRTGGFDPEIFYATWIARAGAPELRLVTADSGSTGDLHVLTIELEQAHGGPLYPLRIPVYVTLEGESAPRVIELSLDERTERFLLDYEKRPLRVDVDPALEVFRALSPLDRPAALSRLFGAERQWLVVPDTAPPAIRAAWRELAAAWSGRYGNVELITDSEADGLPADAAVWLLGWDNMLAQAWRDRFTGQGQRLDGAAVVVGGEVYGRATHAVVLLDPDNARTPLGFIGADDVTVIRRLAGKLTHYGSMGRLAFTLPDLDNRLRESLHVMHSPLSRQFADSAPRLALPPETSLADSVRIPLPD